MKKSKFAEAQKPTDNAFIESFNGKFPAECLNTHWFRSLDDAKVEMGGLAWRRPRSPISRAIDHKAPIELMKRSGGRQTA